MPIIEKTQTEDEIKQGNQAGESKRQSLSERIKGGDVFKNLDIPTGDPIEEEAEQPQEGEDAQEEQEPLDQEESEEVESEDAEADDLSELAEDMIPKSKIQPRMDRLNSKIKALEAENESLKINRATDEQKPVDEVTAKLQKMSMDELKSLRRDIRVAQLNSKDDKVKLTELLDIEDKIDETVRTAPQRFLQAQTAAYNKMADRIAQGYTPKQVEEAAPEIIKIARGIYQKYPKLQSDVEGQAIALELAADKYKELSKYSIQKGSVKNLKSQVNTLKRKTSLENGSSKMAVDTSAVDQLRKNASGGTTRDKLALVKGDPRFNVDAMVPAEYR